MLLQRPRAERPLVLRGEVGLVLGRADQRERVAEVDDRDLLGHHRHLGAGTLGRPGACSCTPATMPASTSRSTRSTSRWSSMKPELDVERDVLRQVPHGVVRLGAEDRPDLVDALEDADQLLLVELRALGEVRRAPEVVDLEDVGAGLGRRRHELRGLDLGEAAPRRGSRGSRGPRRRPAPTAARWAGCRQVTGAWSSRVGREAFSSGRQSSTGGVAAGSVNGVITGSVSSMPPGACGLAVAVPTTSTVVSSGGRALPSRTTTCARPLRSRTTRKATVASSRRRWTQPCSRTVSPGVAWGSAALSVRAGSVRFMRFTSRESGSPGDVGGGEVAVPPHLRQGPP